MEDKLIEFLKENIGYDIDVEKLLEKPKVVTNGDFSLPCFILAKELKKAHFEISKDIAQKLENVKPDFLEKIVAIGPFVNFYLNSLQEAKDVFGQILDGSIFEFEHNNKNMLMEYPSPNTNKSLHIGHVRNILIGNSLAKIWEKTGNNVIKTCINNDRGIAICKSMLGYELFNKENSPESLGLKSDEFVSKCYVDFGNAAKEDESLNEQAQDMLVKWEAGDEEVIALWKKVMKWVFDGYKITYENLKLGEFDAEYFESKIYKNGREIVEEGLKKNIQGFGREEDGAVFCDLSDIGLDKKYLLRGDGTTLYMTQDLYLNSLKQEAFNPDQSIFIVGKEQEYHFKVLFEILSRLGNGDVSKNYHFAYGYVYDKNGKKFSSRKGEVIGADWLLNKVLKKAEDNLLIKEISKDLDKAELKRRAKVIGYSALAFSMLKVNPIDDTKFDLDRSLAFEGETGPYVQYTYARIQSIFRKAGFDIDSIDINNIDYSLLDDREKNLVKILKDYREIVELASSRYKISSIANYLIKLCKGFNEFYQNSPIINSDERIKQIRLILSHLVAKTIKDGLELLDIEVLDEM